MTQHDRTQLTECMMELETSIHVLAAKFAEWYRCEFDDLMQEGRLAAWKALINSDPALGSPMNWAIKKARWAMMDWSTQTCRAISGRSGRRRVWREMSSIDYTSEDVDEVPEPWSIEAHKEHVPLDDLNEALAQLKPRERFVVDNHYLQGRSLLDLSSHMHCTASNLSYIARTARRKLRKMLRN